jgi:hypothetical protein
MFVEAGIRFLGGFSGAGRSTVNRFDELVGCGSGNPEQQGQLFSSEAEAWGVADVLNDREVKLRSLNLREAQHASVGADSRK